MSVFLDGTGESVRSGYEMVREQGNGINWVLLAYVGKLITVAATGEFYTDFLNELKDDERNYGYVRFDNKFAFITWIGPGVPPLKKARVSTDKAFVKEVMPKFSREILADEKKDLAENRIRQILGIARKRNLDERNLDRILKELENILKGGA